MAHVIWGKYNLGKEIGQFENIKSAAFYHIITKMVVKKVFVGTK